MPYTPYPKAARTWIPLEQYPEYAALIGRIIGQFALVEQKLPDLMRRMMGIEMSDALAILGVFRAVNNRIDVLQQLLPNRPKAERIVFTHFKDRIADANGIRNKYAHAMYSVTKEGLHIQPFSGRHNNPQDSYLLRIGEIKRDEDAISRINTELSRFLNGDAIPRTLWKKLPPEYGAKPHLPRSRRDEAPESAGDQPPTSEV